MAHSISLLPVCSDRSDGRRGGAVLCSDPLETTPAQYAASRVVESRCSLASQLAPLSFSPPSGFEADRLSRCLLVDHRPASRRAVIQSHASYQINPRDEAIYSCDRLFLPLICPRRVQPRSIERRLPLSHPSLPFLLAMSALRLVRSVSAAAQQQQRTSDNARAQRQQQQRTRARL